MIEISGLTRRFGAVTALDGVSFSLERGGVYGLVGANGAGKTTLIRHILGLLRAESGSVRVFGLDPVADPVGVLSRIGFDVGVLPGASPDPPARAAPGCDRRAMMRIYWPDSLPSRAAS